MFSVAIHLSSPQSETQWDFVLSNFKPDEVVVLGDYEPTSKVLRSARRSLPTEGERVILAPQNGRYISGTIALCDFTHPEHATYIFGPDNAHLHDIEGDHYVYIPTDTHHEMYSWVAGAVTLWDRRCG